MQILDTLHSRQDATIKLVFAEGDIVSEVTYLRKGDGKDILVVPSQTSCKLGCQFCHLTGLDVPVRNLSPAAIIEMVRQSTEHLKLQESGNDTMLVSFMGAGEPLLNVEWVIEAATRLRAHPTHRVTRFAVATLIPGETPFREFTRRVKETGLDMKLHWSLHSVDPCVRKELMPAALHLTASVDLLTYYSRETGRATEIHYTLMADVNDRPEDVEGLAALLTDKGMVIKLLRLAPREEVSLRESERVDAFRALLTEEGFSTEVYAPPGRDIGSSCGQFRLSQYLDPKLLSREARAGT